MSRLFVGRKKEKEILQTALESSEAELVAVIGRRRVGKTYLIRTAYKDRIRFEMTGIQNGSLQEQLQHFTQRLNFHIRPSIPYSVPSNWLEAFQMLTLHFESNSEEQKIVLFFDELPWIATRRSGFLKAFGAFWNNWASQKNLVIVICGSAASWMIQKVVRDKGGLHNRITRRIQLEPFNLAETADFLKARSFNFDPYQILQLYMAMGGIPHYLKEIEGGQSAAQNIDRIFFSKSGYLKEEFNLLYPALFENAERHIKIIRILAEKWQGLSRKELIAKTNFSNGGALSKTLEELTYSGFIMPFYSFGKKKKNMLYRLVDEYSIFYLKFIDSKRLEESGMWKKFSQTQTYKIWTGFAFENVCLKHIAQIKKAMGISGVYSETSMYRSQARDETPGIQIDLLIDRNDHVINLLELKFYNAEFRLTKEYATKLRTKMEVFRQHTNTRKQLFWTLLTTFGLQASEYSLGLVDEVLSMEVFFRRWTKEQKPGYHGIFVHSPNSTSSSTSKRSPRWAI